MIHRVEIPDTATTVALCGGPYSNFAAVAAFLAATADIPHRFCLGDLGGLGPHPDRTVDLIRGSNLVCLKGNYDHAVGCGERDCGCGYVDPRDREYAQIAYDYTVARTAAHHKAWLRGLPDLIELGWRGKKVLLCHGSPDSVNEFVWESETDDATIDAWLARLDVHGICATHSGLPWIRATARGFWCNVGVLGRPAHDGTRSVRYARLAFPDGRQAPRPELVRLDYNAAPVTAAMRAEGLPEAFAESLEQGIWTTCAAILPPAERDVAARCPALTIATSPPTSTPHARDPSSAAGD
jgi:hypothetical protein